MKARPWDFKLELMTRVAPPMQSTCSVTPLSKAVATASLQYPTNKSNMCLKSFALNTPLRYFKSPIATTMTFFTLVNTMEIYM
jgi:hypothetical protein